MRVLQIIEPAHRATTEEQDDTVLWFTRAIRAAGAAADVLLVGTASCYVARGQACPAVRLGAWQQRHPPEIEQEITKLMEGGARVFVLREDLDERGIGLEATIPGVSQMPRAELPALLGGYEYAWKW